MNEEHFWSMIATAWADSSDFDRERLTFVAAPCTERQPSYDALLAFMGTLSERLERLDASDLVAFDRILERKLYDLDREEVHDYTDGSDDGFLYSRGFIVAMGRSYYEAVNSNPAVAVFDCECEELCYLPVDLYEEKFGKFPRSDISRESGSHDDGKFE